MATIETTHAAANTASRPVGEAEPSLVDRLRAGEDAAFEEMLREHGGRLLAVARRMLRHEEDARDALQDGLVSACRALPTFRGECQLSTWLHRIVVNTALMKMRSRRRSPELPLDGLLPVFQADGHHAEMYQPWADVERALARSEVRAEVRAAIDRLPETYRTVLLLRDIEELSTEEAARALGVTANAVKIRLHRARQAVRTLLTPTLGPAGVPSSGAARARSAGSALTPRPCAGGRARPAGRAAVFETTLLVPLAAVPA